jgi:hypothetical protein
MSMNENQHDTPTAPPPLPESAYPAALTPARPPRWPIVIGILSICLAGWGMVSLQLSQSNARMNSAAREILTMFPDWYMEYSEGAVFIGLGVSVILLLAGIQTLRRKPRGRMWHMLYAALAIIQVVIGCILFSIALGQLDSTSQSQPVTYYDIVQVSGFAGMRSGAAYPIFLLIWFSLRKIREQVRQWG